MKDLLIINDIKFRRDKKTNYYLSSKAINGKRIRLHRYIWENEFGTIPIGFDIHHKDQNKFNNEIDNLKLIPGKIHQKLHGSLLTKEEKDKLKIHVIEKMLPLAKEWHKSESGRQWHSKHAKENAININPREYNCFYCQKLFTTKPFGINKFCSNKCKSSWRRDQGIDNIIKICTICNNEYSSNKYQKTKCCSKDCRLKLRKISK